MSDETIRGTWRRPWWRRLLGRLLFEVTRKRDPRRGAGMFCTVDNEGAYHAVGYARDARYRRGEAGAAGQAHGRDRERGERVILLTGEDAK